MNHLKDHLHGENVLAKALYDNVAESPDELSFRKGDIMTVLERDTQGLDGWWLCSLHGRQGIVPGNRLKILVGMHDKKPAGPGPGPPATSAQPQPGPHAPAAQYTPMLPATYQPQPDSVYLVPTPSKTQQSLYQAPGPSPQFQSPPAKQTTMFSKQMPHHPFPSPAPDLYQVPPGPGSPAQDIYQVPPSAGVGHDIYQVPPSMDARSWEGTKPPAKVVVPTRVGQGYVFEASQPEQDEYDIPRHLLAPGPQDIYDVPPVRGLLPSQYGQEVGEELCGFCSSHPLSVEKGLPLSNHHAVSSQGILGPHGLRPDLYKEFWVYDVPPSVSKDVPDGPLLREETYDVPPAFAKAKPFDPTRHPLVLAAPPPDSLPAEDVYDVPPPAPDLYDVPPGLRRPGPGTLYDVPRERLLPPEASDGGAADDTVYAVPPPAEREAPADGKRLSASSTGSTRSSQSASSLEAAVPGREPLELEGLGRQLQKMEDVYQTLVAHGQALDGGRGGPGAAPEDLDRLVACSRAVPEDAKQLASFLHGNASLLFRRTKAPVPGPEGGGSLHPNPIDKASSIQSRPLPSPPKFTSQDSPDGQYENSEGGWMEDYDYVHLQGKEEFEKTQKELLEKGNIMRQGKGQLELQQLKQFERLEQEVSRPIDHDLANWTAAQPLAPGRPGGLGPSERQGGVFFPGNLVCDLLRGIVATTKAAALQYPSPAAAQDMVDRVKELGHSTQQFRRVLGQLAAA
uniref:BCAR1 scaffold protein, Cas family member n=1 Tax=Panthera tigris altaica TaxID=74533 RepID=A0A8C9JN35_PANTA